MEHNNRVYVKIRGAYVPTDYTLERIEQLERDKARLDWLNGLCPDSCWQWDVSVRTDCVFLCKNTTGGFPTASQAIDAAREREVGK